MYYYNSSTGESSWNPPPITETKSSSSSTSEKRRKKKLRQLEVKLNEKTKRVNDLTQTMRELKREYVAHKEMSKSQIDELSTNVEALKATIESKDKQRDSLVRAQREELNRRDENLVSLKKSHLEKVEDLNRVIMNLKNDETICLRHVCRDRDESDADRYRYELWTHLLLDLETYVWCSRMLGEKSIPQDRL